MRYLNIQIIRAPYACYISNQIECIYTPQDGGKCKRAFFVARGQKTQNEKGEFIYTFTNIKPKDEHLAGVHIRISNALEGCTGSEYEWITGDFANARNV